MPIKKRRKLSAYINVRLSERNEADLIAWWAELAPSTGGAFVKAAIRAQLDVNEKQKPSTDKLIVESAEWQNEQAADRAEQADLRIADLTAQIGALAAQLASLSAQLANGAFVVQAAAPDDDSPRLSTAEQNARLKKVKSQQW